MGFFVLFLVCALLGVGCIAYVGMETKNRLSNEQNHKQACDSFSRTNLENAPDYVKKAYQMVKERKKLDCDMITFEFSDLPNDITSNMLAIGHTEVIRGTLMQSLSYSNVLSMGGIFAIFPNYLVTDEFCLNLGEYTSFEYTKLPKYPSSGQSSYMALDSYTHQSADAPKEKSVIGNAVVGGVLFGGAGAVVGAISAADYNARNMQNSTPAQPQNKTDQSGGRDMYSLKMKRRDGLVDEIIVSFTEIPQASISGQGEIEFVSSNVGQNHEILMRNLRRAFRNVINVDSFIR